MFENQQRIGSRQSLPKSRCVYLHPYSPNVYLQKVAGHQLTPLIHTETAENRWLKSRQFSNMFENERLAISDENHQSFGPRHNNCYR